MVNPNLEQYKLVGPRETPADRVVVLENYQGQSATDAYGIAEPANIATAPAIANAVYNADRRPLAQPADDAGRGARCARQSRRRGVDGHEPFRLDASAKNDLRGGDGGIDDRRPCHDARHPNMAGQSEIAVVKAGGIDLLDLMKEGLLAPSQGGEPERDSRA